MSSLKNEMERQKSLRELDEKELEIRAQSRLSSRGSKGHTHKAGGGGGGRARSTSPISKLLAESYDAEQVNTNRESLMQTLTETELDLSAVNRQIDLVKETLRILIRVSERVQGGRGGGGQIKILDPTAMGAPKLHLTRVALYKSSIKPLQMKFRR